MTCIPNLGLLNFNIVRVLCTQHAPSITTHDYCVASLSHSLKTLILAPQTHPHPRPPSPCTAAHGEVKFNAWEKPTEIAKWKEEHIVFAVLGGWAVTIYSATKIFGGGKKEAPAAEPSK